MIKETQYWFCPANKNHKLPDERTFRRHLNRCKEIKSAGGVHTCKYNGSHAFLTKEAKNSHELECPTMLNQDDRIYRPPESAERQWVINEPIYQSSPWEPQISKKKRIQELQEDQSSQSFKKPLSTRELAMIEKARKAVLELKNKCMKIEKKYNDMKRANKLKDMEMAKIQELKEEKIQAQRLIEKERFLIKERIQKSNCEALDIEQELYSVKHQLDIKRESVFQEKVDYIEVIEMRNNLRKLKTQQEKSVQLLEKLRMAEARVNRQFKDQEAIEQELIKAVVKIEDKLQYMKEKGALEKLRKIEPGTESDLELVKMKHPKSIAKMFQEKKMMKQIGNESSHRTSESDTSELA